MFVLNLSQTSESQTSKPIFSMKHLFGSKNLQIASIKYVE